MSTNLKKDISVEELSVALEISFKKKKVLTPMSEMLSESYQFDQS